MDHPARERAMDDLLNGERQLRELSESTARGLREVLTEIGFRWGGQQLEAMRRDDPTAPANWSPTVWKQFFNTLPVPTLESGWGGGGAAQPSAKVMQQEATVLREENDWLRYQLDQAQRQRTVSSTSATTTNTAAPVTSPAVSKAKNEKGSGRGARQETEKATKTPPAPKSDSNLVKVGPSFQPIVDEMRSLAIPKKPARFESRLSIEEVRYRRQIQALYLVACHGSQRPADDRFADQRCRRVEPAQWLGPQAGRGAGRKRVDGL